MKKDGFFFMRTGQGQRQKETGFRKKERKVSKRSLFCTFASGLEGRLELQLLLCDIKNLLSAAF